MGKSRKDSRTLRLSTVSSAKRRLASSVALTLILLNSQSGVQANEWTGPENGDFFAISNWSDNAGPQGSASTFTSGAAQGTIDLGGSANGTLARIIGTGAGNSASVVINIKTSGSNQASLNMGDGSNPFLLGTDGASGALSLVLDGPTATYLGSQELVVGQGTGSVGILNLIGTGKETDVPPEGPMELGYSCYSCAPMYNASGGAIIIGENEGTGTVNIQGASLGLGPSGVTIGDGIGSNGTLNVLAGGKLGDNYTGYGAMVVVGNGGGIGALNIDGSGASSINDAPFTILNRGLTIGNGAGSIGSVNIISQGKVHTFINSNYLSDPSLRAELDTRLGIDGGSGMISVSGAGSVWYQSGVTEGSIPSDGSVNTDPGVLRVGQSGRGEVVIADQGVVRVGSATILGENIIEDGIYRNYYSLADHVSNGTVILAVEPSSTGTLSIGGAVGGAAVAPGRLMAQTVEFGDGTGLIRFNHTADNYIFDQFDAQYLDGPSRPSTLSIVGDGTIEAAAGRTILSENQLSFTGTLLPSTGILQVNGDISTATVNILAGGTLEGTGIVGSTVNAGTIAPGQTPDGSQGLVSSIGTLTIAGNYTGQGGVLSLDTVLGNDSSLTDKLAIIGNSSGNTTVKVKNINGDGDDTIEGIQIVTVGGTSDPNAFSLAGDYVFNGQQAVVGGAYAYRLYQGSISQPGDGNWYLRSNRIPTDPVDPDIPVDPDEPDQPIYQPGVSLYEAYPQFLLGLNSLPTLQQRTGNRYWSNAGNVMLAEGADPVGPPYAPAAEAGNLIEGRGVWGRIEGSHSKIDPKFSTSGENYDYNIFKLQAGLDGMLLENEAGKLIGGITVHYTHGKAKTYSIFGDDEVSTDGYGFGGTLTWYGDNGFYVDGQAQLTWYDSDLSANNSQFTAGLNGLNLADGNNGFGFAISGETGQRVTLNQNWSITPQAQLTYSKVDFDSFNDVFGARVSLDRGEGLQGRLGLAVEHQNSWYNASGLIDRAQVYGIANLYYEFLEGTKVDVSGTTFANENERLWGGIGLGGSYNWNSDKYSIYGEGAINTSLADFGDSYSYKGTLGFRVKW